MRKMHQIKSSVPAQSQRWLTAALSQIKTEALPTETARLMECEIYSPSCWINIELIRAWRSRNMTNMTRSWWAEVTHTELTRDRSYKTSVPLDVKVNPDDVKWLKINSLVYYSFLQSKTRAWIELWQGTAASSVALFTAVTTNKLH